MDHYKAIQKQKYLIYQKNKKIEKYKAILPSYSDDEIIRIINNKYIEKIELFYKKYRYQKLYLICYWRKNLVFMRLKLLQMIY